MRWKTERSAFHSKSHKIRLTDWMTDCLESSRISIGIVRLNGAETPKHMLPTMISIKMLIKLHVLRWLHFAFANDFITHLTNAMNSSLYKYANREYEQNFMLNYQIPSPIRSCTSLINITHTHTHRIRFGVSIELMCTVLMYRVDVFASGWLARHSI